MGMHGDKDENTVTVIWNFDIFRLDYSILICWFRFLYYYLY